MSNRNPLANRRSHEAFNLELRDMPPVTVGLGYYDADGPDDEKRLGEVFITAGKVGSQFEIECGDEAVLISLALQHGISVAELYNSMARTPEGKPASVVGHILFGILQEQSREPVTDVPSDQGDGDIKTRGVEGPDGEDNKTRGVEGRRPDGEDNNGSSFGSLIRAALARWQQFWRELDQKLTEDTLPIAPPYTPNCPPPPPRDD